MNEALNNPVLEKIIEALNSQEVTIEQAKQIMRISFGGTLNEETGRLKMKIFDENPKPL